MFWIWDLGETLTSLLCHTSCIEVKTLRSNVIFWILMHIAWAQTDHVEFELVIRHSHIIAHTSYIDHNIIAYEMNSQLFVPTYTLYIFGRSVPWRKNQVQKWNERNSRIIDSWMQMQSHRTQMGIYLVWYFVISWLDTSHAPMLQIF